MTVARCSYGLKPSVVQRARRSDVKALHEVQLLLGGLIVASLIGCIAHNGGAGQTSRGGVV